MTYRQGENYSLVNLATIGSDVAQGNTPVSTFYPFEERYIAPTARDGFTSGTATIPPGLYRDLGAVGFLDTLHDFKSDFFDCQAPIKSDSSKYSYRKFGFSFLLNGGYPSLLPYNNLLMQTNYSYFNRTPRPLNQDNLENYFSLGNIYDVIRDPSRGKMYILPNTRAYSEQLDKQNKHYINIYNRLSVLFNDYRDENFGRRIKVIVDHQMNFYDIMRTKKEDRTPKEDGTVEGQNNFCILYTAETLTDPAPKSKAKKIDQCFGCENWYIEKLDGNRDQLSSEGILGNVDVNFARLTLNKQDDLENSTYTVTVHYTSNGETEEKTVVMNEKSNTINTIKSEIRKQIENIRSATDTFAVSLFKTAITSIDNKRDFYTTFNSTMDAGDKQKYKKDYSIFYARKRLGDTLQGRICLFDKLQNVRFNSVERTQGMAYGFYYKINQTNPKTATKSAVLVTHDRMLFSYAVIQGIPVILDLENNMIVFVPTGLPTEPRQQSAPSLLSNLRIFSGGFQQLVPKFDTYNFNKNLTNSIQKGGMSGKNGQNRKGNNTQFQRQSNNFQSQQNTQYYFPAPQRLEQIAAHTQQSRSRREARQQQQQTTAAPAPAATPETAAEEKENMDDYDLTIDDIINNPDNLIRFLYLFQNNTYYFSRSKNLIEGKLQNVEEGNFRNFMNIVKSNLSNRTTDLRYAYLGEYINNALVIAPSNKLEEKVDTIRVKAGAPEPTESSQSWSSNLLPSIITNTGLYGNKILISIKLDDNNYITVEKNITYFGVGIVISEVKYQWDQGQQTGVLELTSNKLNRQLNNPGTFKLIPDDQGSFKIDLIKIEINEDLQNNSLVDILNENLTNLVVSGVTLLTVATVAYRSGYIGGGGPEDLPLYQHVLTADFNKLNDPKNLFQNNITVIYFLLNLLRSYEVSFINYQEGIESFYTKIDESCVLSDLIGVTNLIPHQIEFYVFLKILLQEYSETSVNRINYALFEYYLYIFKSTNNIYYRFQDIKSYLLKTNYEISITPEIHNEIVKTNMNSLKYFNSLCKRATQKSQEIIVQNYNASQSGNFDVIYQNVNDYGLKLCGFTEMKSDFINKTLDIISSMSSAGLLKQYTDTSNKITGQKPGDVARGVSKPYQMIPTSSITQQPISVGVGGKKYKKSLKKLRKDRKRTHKRKNNNKTKRRRK